MIHLATANDVIHTLLFKMNLEELFTLENMNNAFYKCAKISHWKESTQRYQSNLLPNNIKLQKEILNYSYKVSPTVNFEINERGKIRSIEAPAMRDRIIQKVICREILIPQLTPYLIYDNYASLKGRGTSFARKRLNIQLRRYIDEYGDDGYILKVDIKKFFESIDHTVIKQMLSIKLKDISDDIISLIFYFIDTSSNTDKGLNLGAEIPQILAIFYLHKVDNYVKTVKGIKYYGRYMDDIFLISNSKKELKEVLDGIKLHLLRLKLELNEKKTAITTLHHGFTYMQIKYNVVDGKIIKRPTRSKIVRERRRLKKYKGLYEQGLMSELEIRNCYLSWRGSLLKDCNACYKTVISMDKLYNDLFPIKEMSIKKKRNEAINEAFTEYGMDIRYDYYGLEDIRFNIIRAN